MKADTVIYGNIITMETDYSRAEALAVKDGRIIFVGDREDVEEYIGENTRALHYGDSYIYPGFIEGHCHPVGAGLAMLNLSAVDCHSTEELLKLIEKYVSDNPAFDQYRIDSWHAAECPIDKKLLDEICSDKLVVVLSDCGHICCANTAAMNILKIDESWVKKYGTDMVRVDDNGEMTGVFNDAAKNDLCSAYPTTVSEFEKAILDWQSFALSNGITAAGEACVNIVGEGAVEAYHNVAADGRLIMPTFAMFETRDDGRDMVKDAERIAGLRDKYATGNFKMDTIKVFVDGVTEGHTGWFLNEYRDEPGFYGLQRVTHIDALTAMTQRAYELGMNVHFHTIGDAAAKCVCDSFEDIDKDILRKQRNAMAHLEYVRPEEIKRIGDMNITAVVAPMWVSKDSTPPASIEAQYVGWEMVENAYPIRSLIDAGAKVTFHSDFPVSPKLNMPLNIYTAVVRNNPDAAPEMARKPEEAVTRYEALCALTKNAAYQFRAEDQLGTLEVGKVANMVVYDRDFMNCRLEKIATATLMATVINGEEVYESSMEGERSAIAIDLARSWYQQLMQFGMLETHPELSRMLERKLQ